MTVQAIERDTLRDMIRDILREDRNLLKRLVKEIMEEQKQPVVQEVAVVESVSVQENEEIRILKNIDAIMSKHDNLLKRLAQ